MGILGDALAGLALPGNIWDSLVGNLGSGSNNPSGQGNLLQILGPIATASPANDSAWANAEQQESIVTQNYANALDDLKNNQDPTPHVNAAAQATQQAFQQLDQDFEQQYAIASQSQNPQQRAVATQQMCNDLQLARSIIQNQHAFQRQLALEVYTLAQQHNAVPGGGTSQCGCTQGTGLTPAQQAALQNQWSMGGMSPLSGMSQSGMSQNSAGSAASSNPMSSMMSMLPMLAMPAMMMPMMIPSMISGMAGHQPTPGSQGAEVAGATSPDGGLQAQEVDAAGIGDVDGGDQAQSVSSTSAQPDAHTQPASSAESVGSWMPTGSNTDVQLADGTTIPNTQAAIAARATLNGTTSDVAYQQPGATMPAGTPVVNLVAPRASAARRRREVKKPSDDDAR